MIKKIVFIRVLIVLSMLLWGGAVIAFNVDYRKEIAAGNKALSKTISTVTDTVDSRGYIQAIAQKCVQLGITATMLKDSGILASLKTSSKQELVNNIPWAVGQLLLRVPQAQRTTQVSQDFTMLFQKLDQASDQAKDKKNRWAEFMDSIQSAVEGIETQAAIQAKINEANARVEAAKAAAGQGSSGVNVEWMDSGYKINFWVGTRLKDVLKTFNQRLGKDIPFQMVKVNVNGQQRHSDQYELQAGDFVRIWPDPLIVGFDALVKFVKDISAKAQKEIETAVSNASKVVIACGEVGVLEARLHGLDDVVNFTVDSVAKTALVVSEGLKGVANVGNIFMIRGGNFHGKLANLKQTGVKFSLDMTVFGKAIKPTVSLNPADFADVVGTLIKENLP